MLFYNISYFKWSVKRGLTVEEKAFLGYNILIYLCIKNY